MVVAAQRRKNRPRDASAFEKVFNIRLITIRTWLCYSGMQGKKLQERLLLVLDLILVQLNKLWAKTKHTGQEMWVWVESNVTSKIASVIQAGRRTQEMAYRVVHELKEDSAQAGCLSSVPTD